MVRTPPKLKHVKHVRRGQKWYAYFNTGQQDRGRPIYKPLPAISAPDFWPVYTGLLAARARRSVTEYTVADLARDYQRSPRFATLSANSRRLYVNQIVKIDRIWGRFPVDQLTPARVRMALDGEGWAAGTRNTVIGVLGALYTWGRKHDKTQSWPTKDIDRHRGGEHEPWPVDLLEAGLQADCAEVRLLVHLLYFTGLRINDALALRWGQIGSHITVTPTKTARFRKVLEIPVAAELRAELDRTPRTGLRICEGITYRRARSLLQGFTLARGVQTVPHGLRKNAVNALLEAGCTVSEVAAITGQTLQVIEHYAARVNQRKLGNAAILKFEAARRTG